MKDFSVNNIIVTGQAPVLEGDLGTEPNQIPLNKDLGSLAYQDAVNLDDVSADMLELRAIAAIQEQQTIINDLKSRIETLEQQ